MTAVEGHVIVDTLAGSATVTVHRRIGPYCYELGTVLLDPDQVLELATTLTRAAVPPPPTTRRLQVRTSGGVWTVVCPECVELPGTWHDHQLALKAARWHIETEHALEGRVA